MEHDDGTEARQACRRGPMDDDGVSGLPRRPQSSQRAPSRTAVNPNPKSQAPDSNRNPNMTTVIGIWDLGFGVGDFLLLPSLVASAILARLLSAPAHAAPSRTAPTE